MVFPILQLRRGIVRRGAEGMDCFIQGGMERQQEEDGEAESALNRRGEEGETAAVEGGRAGREDSQQAVKASLENAATKVHLCDRKLRKIRNEDQSKPVSQFQLSPPLETPVKRQYFVG